MNQFVSTLIVALFYIGSVSSQSLTVLSWNLKDFGQSRDDQEIELNSGKAQNVKIVVLEKEII